MGKKKSEGIISSIVEIGTEPFFMIITTVFTVASGVCVNFFEESSTLYKVCDRGFFISLSLVIIQLLLQMYGVGRSINAVRENLSNEESVVFPKDKADIDKMMQSVLASPNACRVKIICYGTNKYGKVIDQIIEEYDNIKQIDIIVCSPECNLFPSHESDSLRINLMLNETYKQFTNKNNKKRKLSLYMSKVPPTIRASAVYDNKGKPLWCTYQSYYIFLGEGTLLRGQAVSPAIVAKDTYSSILIELTKNFEKEFSRLLKECEEYIDTEK